MSHTYLRFPAVPNLPLAPKDYDSRYQEQFNNVLRLYFNQNTNAIQALAGRQGGYHLSFPSAAVSRTTDKTFTANTATLITFDSSEFLQGFSNPGTDGLIADYPGIYNYQFSIQLQNTDTQAYDVDVWLRKNNVDLVGTGSRYDVPSKHGIENGHLIAVANFFVELDAGDSVSMYMAVASTTVSCKAFAAQTVPYARPSVPSVVATLTFVSSPNE